MGCVSVSRGTTTPNTRKSSQPDKNIYILAVTKDMKSNMLPFWTGWNLKPCQDFKVSDVFFIIYNAWDDICVTQFAAEMIQCQIPVTTVIILLGLWTFPFNFLRCCTFVLPMALVFAASTRDWDEVGFLFLVEFCLFVIECICLCTH